MSRDFSIDEWLKWSKLNIHYYCTTSLEASAMGVENLAFNPDINEKYFRTIPYLFSHKINSLNKIIFVLFMFLINFFRILFNIIIFSDSPIDYG